MFDCRASHAKGMSGVVDDFDAVLVGEAVEALDVAHVAVDMDGDDGLRNTGLDEFFHRSGREAQRFWINVGENWLRADAHERVRRRHERKRRRDDFRALKSQCLESHLQCQGPVVKEREIGFWHLKIMREFRMEAPEHRPVVREPLVSPDFRTTGLERLQVGQVRAGHENRLFESSHANFLPWNPAIFDCPSPIPSSDSVISKAIISHSRTRCACRNHRHIRDSETKDDAKAIVTARAAPAESVDRLPVPPTDAAP